MKVFVSDRATEQQHLSSNEIVMGCETENEWHDEWET